MGCGTGNLERYAIDNNMVKQIIGIDVSTERIRNAKSKTEGRNIAYVQTDLNSIKLDNNKYDFVIAKMIFHHISHLEHLFSELSKSLTDNGLIYVSEYIGPNRFQFSDKVVVIMNDLLSTIPRKYRKLAFDNVSIKNRVSKIPIEQIINGDPTEAIRSEEINSLIPNYFEIVESHQTGGTLLFWMLDGIAHNFDNSRESIKILEELTNIEKNLTEKKEIPEYFKVYVLKKKSLH